MRDALEQAAQEHGVSLSMEVTRRLTASFAEPPPGAVRGAVSQISGALVALNRVQGSLLDRATELEGAQKDGLLADVRNMSRPQETIFEAVNVLMLSQKGDAK